MAGKGYKKDTKRVMVMCAHNDDNIIGAGGTIAKYADEGKEVITVFFSYGETSHPYLKKDITIKMRVKESKEAGKILGEKKMVYLGLKDGALHSETKKAEVKNKIRSLIVEYRPEKVFTHSEDDPHPDHRAVNKAVLEALENVRCRCDMYTFPVWNVLSVRERNHPKMFVDITSTFRRKIDSLYAHKSQKLAIYSLITSIYIRAFLNGLHSDVRYAEVFYKVR